MTHQGTTQHDTQWWIDRQAAIDAKRAIAEYDLNRYDQVENGWDPSNDLEVTDVRTMERIQAEIATDLDKCDITLIHRVGYEGVFDPDTMARSDGRASNDRVVCRPAAMWSSREYGPIVLIRAITYQA